VRLELYQQETAQIAQRQLSVLDEVAEQIQQGKILSPLEQNGVLHALQVLTENAIGKAKHLIKSTDRIVPLSDYDTFSLLSDTGHIAPEDLENWHRTIGLRNKIVHDYMNIRMEIVLELVEKRDYRFIGEFLLQPITTKE
jgi:uncharacterized protein YutE (UPF0331/DUF86 family)